MRHGGSASARATARSARLDEQRAGGDGARGGVRRQPRVPERRVRVAPRRLHERAAGADDQRGHRLELGDPEVEVAVDEVDEVAPQAAGVARAAPAGAGRGLGGRAGRAAAVPVGAGHRLGEQAGRAAAGPAAAPRAPGRGGRGARANAGPRLARVAERAALRRAARCRRRARRPAVWSGCGGHAAAANSASAEPAVRLAPPSAAALAAAPDRPRRAVGTHAGSTVRCCASTYLHCLHLSTAKIVASSQAQLGKLPNMSARRHTATECGFFASAET